MNREWITVDAVCANGACSDGALEWVKTNAPGQTALPRGVVLKLASGQPGVAAATGLDGNGDGNGYGNGYGNGDGNGDGYGYGNGNGNCYGDSVAQGER